MKCISAVCAGGHFEGMHGKCDDYSQGLVRLQIDNNVETIHASTFVQKQRRLLSHQCSVHIVRHVAILRLEVEAKDYCQSVWRERTGNKSARSPSVAMAHSARGS